MVTKPVILADKPIGTTPEPVESTAQANALLRRLIANANIAGTASKRVDGFKKRSVEALLRAIASGRVGIVNMEDPALEILTVKKRRS